MPDWRPIVAWLTALAIVLLRASCRIRRHGDPRGRLRARSQTYAYSILHAHQVAAIMDGERGTGAMVSRSSDGGLIIPSLRVRGIVPVRGSSHRDGLDKGGLTAFNRLVQHVLAGSPVYFAVDGPRGPRNRIHPGVALLSQKTGAAVLNIVPVPTRRWILSGAWDRLQIPKPFTRIDIYFSDPIYPRDGEGVEKFRRRIERDLNALERRHDRAESELCRSRPTDTLAPLAPIGTPLPAASLV